MAIGLIDHPSTHGAKRPRLQLRRQAWRIALGLLLAMLLLLLAGWLGAPQVIDLGIGSQLRRSGLEEQWRQGQVVVMIRHAERCDRSPHPCLDDPEGITRIGSQTALAVGAGLQQLGLANTRLLSSPQTRTRQTAGLISGSSVPTEQWLQQCDGHFEQAVLAHKRPHENLALVTHSGCIDQFERRLGVNPTQRSSDYSQALFVQVDGRHQPKILGSLQAAQWPGRAPLPGG